MRRAGIPETVAALVASLAVRLIRIDARGLWLDEAFSVWLASQPVPAIVGFGDYHPPLYYLLVKGWHALGSWAASDGGVRLPSALASACAAGMAVWLVQRLRLPGAGLVAALSVTSALSVRYAQEARMYAAASLAVLCALGSLALAARGAVENRVASGRPAAAPGPAQQPAVVAWLRRAAPWAGYVASAVAGAYLSYDALPVLVAANGAFLAWLAIARPRRLRSTAAWWAGSQILAWAAFVPQTPHFLATLRAANTLHWSSRFPFVGGAALAALLVAALVAFAAARAPRLRRPAAIGAASAVLLGLASMEVIPQGASVKRHVAVVAPLLVVAAATALAALNAPRRLRYALVAAGLPALLLVLFVHPKEDWRGVAALLRREARPDDAIVLHRGYIELPLGRYYPLEDQQIIRTSVEVDIAFPGRETVPRIWLVESHTGQPLAAAPYAAEGRTLGFERSFVGVAVRRFDRS